MKAKITVFTPTYNRREVLGKCFESLCNQSNKNFIWLIIDDGSTDATKDYIDGLKADFEIKYVYQENGGKHRAHNNAVKNCTTDYFLILDSDDILAEDCIEKLYNYIKEIDDKDYIGGIIGNKSTIKTRKDNEKKMPQIKYSTGIELYQKYGFVGETLRFYKTKVLRKFLFPEIDYEKFAFENVVFDKIDTKYKLLVIQDNLYFFEYLEDGYTKNVDKLKINNPIAYAMSLKSSSDTAITIKNKVRWAMFYIMWCKKMKIKLEFNFLILFLYLPSLFLKLIKYPKSFYSIFETEK